MVVFIAALRVPAAAWAWAAGWLLRISRHGDKLGVGGSIDAVSASAVAVPAGGPDAASSLRPAARPATR
jgi:hypothetical protein